MYGSFLNIVLWVVIFYGLLKRCDDDFFGMVILGWFGGGDEKMDG